MLLKSLQIVFEQTSSYFIAWLVAVSALGLHIFNIVMIVEGTSEKVTPFIMPLKSIHTKIFCFNEQKCIWTGLNNIKSV
jgi:hypothetical protein